jgi:hypothetical protein
MDVIAESTDSVLWRKLKKRMIDGSGIAQNPESESHHIG